MAFPSAPKNKEFFSPNGTTTYQYNDNDNAWFKVNARDKYVESVDYSFALKRNGGGITNPFVGEDNPFNYEYPDDTWDYEYENDDTFTIPSLVSGYYNFTLPYSIPSQNGVPQRETTLIQEVYSEEAVIEVSAGAMLSGIRYRHESVGRDFAALAFGGDTGSGYLDSSESFDGYSWSSDATLNTARRYLGGAGEEYTAVSFGGWNGVVLDNTEVYDGSSWSNSASLNAARNQHGAAGRRYDAIAFGGFNSVQLDSTELFNGFVWSSISATLNIARSGMGQAGFQNETLAFGGGNPGQQVIYEKFNGTTWSNEGNIPTGSSFFPSGGFQNDAFGIGGVSSQQALYYNGSVWTVTGGSPFIIGTSTTDARGSGTGTTGLITGGINFASGETHFYRRPGTKRKIALFTNDTNKTEIPFDDTNISIDGTDLSIIASKISNPLTSEIQVQHSTNDRVFRTLDLSAKFDRIDEGDNFEVIYSPIEASAATSGTTIDLLGTPIPNEDEIRGSYLYCYDAINTANEGEEIKINTNDNGSVTINTAFPQPVSVGDKFYVKKPKFTKVLRFIDQFRTCVNVDLNRYDNLYYLRLNLGGYLDPLDANSLFDSSATNIVANLNYIHQLDGGEGEATLRINGSELTANINNYRFERVPCFYEGAYFLHDFSVSRNGLRFDELQKRIVYEAVKPNYTYTINDYDEIEIVASSKKVVQIENLQPILQDLISSGPAGLETKVGMGEAGVGNSSFVFGGATGSGSTNTNTSYLFDGTTWSTEATLNISRRVAPGTGIINAAIIAGNIGDQPDSETYNGTAWSIIADLNAGKRDGSMVGVSTSAMYIGGTIGGSPNDITDCEIYDGSTWKYTGSLNVGGSYSASTGDISAALAISGLYLSNSQRVEFFNGNSWRSSPDVVQFSDAWFGATGAINAAVTAGGSTTGFTGTSNVIQKFNGSSWQLSSQNLLTARSRNAFTGPESKGVIHGGYNGSTTIDTTEIFRITGNISYNENFINDKKTYLVDPGEKFELIANKESFTTLRTATSNLLNTPLSKHNIIGTTGVALTIGGRQGDPPPGDDGIRSNKWNGDSWAYSDFLATERYYPGSSGSFSAGFAIGGSANGTDYNSTELFNGVGWYTGQNLVVGRTSGDGTGTTFATLFAGGSPSASGDDPTSSSASSYKFDGSSWSTNVGSLNVQRANNFLVGSQEDALCIGGYNTSIPEFVDEVERRIGDVWSIDSLLPTALDNPSVAGSNTITVSLVGGFNGSAVNEASKYVFGTWASDSNPLATRYRGGTGSSDSGLFASGSNAEIGIAQKQNDITLSY